jgi:hypothetical protein
MSAHHDAAHHQHNEANKSKTSFTASFWLVIILVGLFIAALNFIEVMSHDDGGGHGGHATEATHAPAAGGHEADHHDATHQEAAHEHGTAADTTHHEEAAHH